MKRLRPRELTGRPTVSVVIPCYNYGRYLEELVLRLLREPCCAVDILIVDDCSTDGSAAVAADIARRHPRVRTITHERNLGHIATYNEGLAAAEGKYVVLLSADDLLPLGALDRAVALMETHPNVGLVYGWPQSFSGEVPADGSSRVRNWSVWGGHEWLARLCATGRNVTLSPEIVMRTQAMRDMVGYDPRLPQAADLDLWMRTALRWDIGRVNGPVQAWYRVHGENMHLTTYAGMLTDLRERRLTFTTLYEEHALDAPDILALRDRTMAALARQSLDLGTEASIRGDDLEEVQAFGAFAIETWPDIKSRRVWQRFDSGPALGRPPRCPALIRFAMRVRLHLRWRRGRRYGT